MTNKKKMSRNKQLYNHAVNANSIVIQIIKKVYDNII